ncbi:Crp/Fnr family transcriptional regulator [Lichenifustis flavocetrariae]|uniref:Crp/Fnr family transcriptional regulator n=1 Tax=Lichenifustis flavocetrariae TaxID=2949735 RepID=A0AA41Z9U9_9HYPH|nr:Crp/Fnr family transcriptional regulator [Lichenifustis flavocetrariae]MCW6513148.1 Crp/Fnr family transcriptional regulator [Lichenifustis flavocetrariae]
MIRPAESLARLPMFAALDPADIAKLDAQCLWRRADAGHWVLDYGEGGTDVFFVLRGSLRVKILSAGREVVLRDLADGDCFGELAAIDGRPRSAGIVAVTDAVVGRMTAQRFIEAVHRHPALCDEILRRLAAEIRKLANQVNEFSTLSVRQRLYAELLRLGAPRQKSEAAWSVSPPPTHVELASRIATHREAVTRELKALERSGLIERRRGALVLRDPEKLRAMVEEAEA